MPAGIASHYYPKHGGWMQSAAAGWLMTILDSDPRMVAMVQVATTLPMFLLGLPAGALADILDRRRLLLVVETILTFLIGALALLVALHRVTAFDLLAFTFLQGSAAWSGGKSHRSSVIPARQR